MIRLQRTFIFADILIFPQSIQVKNKPTVLRIKKCLKMFLTCILFPFNTWKKTGERVYNKNKIADPTGSLTFVSVS